MKFQEIKNNVFYCGLNDENRVIFDELIPLEHGTSYNSYLVKGSEKIMERLKSRLKIEEGETTEDGLFSIDATRCVGACGIAPVFTVNGEVYGKATVKKLDEVLDKLQQTNQEEK